MLLLGLIVAGELESEVTSAATALSSLTALQEQECTTLEDARAEVQQLENTVQQTRAELHIAHQTATQATKGTYLANIFVCFVCSIFYSLNFYFLSADNEEHYQLTCARMTALREAHCLQSILSQSKHVVWNSFLRSVQNLT